MCMSICFSVGMWESYTSVLIRFVLGVVTFRLWLASRRSEQLEKVEELLLHEYLWLYFNSKSLNWCAVGLAVSMLDCQLRGSGFRSRAGQKFESRFLLHLRLIANSAMMSSLIAHC